MALELVDPMTVRGHMTVTNTVYYGNSLPPASVFVIYDPICKQWPQKPQALRSKHPNLDPCTPNVRRQDMGRMVSSFTYVPSTLLIFLTKKLYNANSGQHYIVAVQHSTLDQIGVCVLSWSCFAHFYSSLCDGCLIHLDLGFKLYAE